MDQEMDFRNFLLTVARHWRLVAIIVLIAVIAGVLVAFLWPPEYRATATVAITKPRYVLDFDDQLRSLSSTTGSSLPLGVIATNAYTQLAMNDELKQLVLKDLGWGISLSELEEMIKIRADSGVIQFTGKATPGPDSTALNSMRCSVLLSRILRHSKVHPFRPPPRSYSLNKLWPIFRRAARSRPWRSNWKQRLRRCPTGWP